MEYGPLRQNNKPVKCVHDDDLTKLSNFLAGDDYLNNNNHTSAPLLFEFGYVLSAISNDYARFWVYFEHRNRNLILHIYTQIIFGNGTKETWIKIISPVSAREIQTRCYQSQEAQSTE